MKLELQYRGKLSNIYVAVLPSGESPALSFLDYLKQRDPKAYTTMVRRYQNHADVGRSRVPQHFLIIRSYGNLWEFKTRRGDRLLCYLLKDGSAVLLNGFRKGDPSRREFERGARMRDDILAREG